MSASLPDLSGRKDIRSILIVRLKALGDIVLSIPLIRAFRENFPDSRMSYLCWGRYSEALSGDTGLDEVIELPEGWAGQVSCIRGLRRRGLDLAVDLLSSPRSAVITWLSGARTRIGMDVGRHGWCYHHTLPRAVFRDGRPVKRYTAESNLEIARSLGLGDSGGPAPFDGRGDERRERELEIGFPAADGERGWACDYISGLGLDSSRLVGLVPGATYRSKSWPEKSFVELCGIMVDKLGLRPIVLWGPGEESLARRIVDGSPGAIMAPETGISRLGALIGRLPLVVSLDSGPKHIAVLEGVPTITLFGPTDPVVWDPLTHKHRAIHREVDCFPCRVKNCEPNVCLESITPREVADEIESMLGRPNEGETADGMKGSGRCR